MSKIALTPNPSGTGVFTIASPATSTDRTLTLPDEAGTIITTAGVPSSAMPAGSVLQVVNANTTTQISSSSNVLTDTGLTASITPLFSSSKVIVLITHGAISRIGYESPSAVAMEIVLLRGSTQLAFLGKHFMQQSYSAQAGSGTGYLEFAGPAISFLDSPATTAAVTYKTQFRNSLGSTNGVRLQDGNSISTITLMEIAA